MSPFSSVAVTAAPTFVPAAEFSSISRSSAVSDENSGDTFTARHGAKGLAVPSLSSRRCPDGHVAASSVAHDCKVAISSVKPASPPSLQFVVLWRYDPPKSRPPGFCIVQPELEALLPKGWAPSL